MQRLARQRDWHLSAILNRLRPTYTDTCDGLQGRQTYTCAHVYTQSGLGLKAIWLQLQQLALGLNEETPVSVKVVPWQRFLFCDQGQHEAPF